MIRRARSYCPLARAAFFFCASVAVRLTVTRPLANASAGCCGLLFSRAAVATPNIRASIFVRTPSDPSPRFDRSALQQRHRQFGFEDRVADQRVRFGETRFPHTGDEGFLEHGRRA